MPWETIWNIVLGIFAFLGGVWTLLRVRDYLWSKASLVATVTPHKSHYLQHFGRDVDDLVGKLEILEENGYLRELENEESSYIKDILTTVKQLRKTLHASELTSLEGEWEVRVRNRGRKPCYEVSLSLPDTELVLVKRAGSAPKVFAIAEEAPIDLGTLKAKEELLVVGWTGSGECHTMGHAARSPSSGVPLREDHDVAA